MDFKLIFIAIGIAILFEGSFFFALSLIYRQREKKYLKFTNTFLFEVVPSFKEKSGIANYLLLFGIVISIFPYIYYVAYNVNTFAMTIAIISILMAFCLVCLPFISLNKLREHYYLALGGLVTLMALLIIEGYYCYRLYRLYLDNMQLVGMIVAFSLALFTLIAIFNPKLFDLKNTQNEAGEYVRKKFIFLSFVEWMLYPFSILALVPLLLVAM